MGRRYCVIILAALLFASILLPSRADSVRFAVMGDTQGSGRESFNPDVFPVLVQEVLSANPPVQFVIVVGDLVQGLPITNDNLANEYQQWRTAASPWYQADWFGLKVYVLPGNHDQMAPQGSLETWQQAFPELPDNGPANDRKATYSFDVGPCHLALVNTDAPDRRHMVDLEWIANDLAASDKPIKLVFGHEPAYKIDIGRIISLDANPELRDQFWQLLASNHVRAYFCGHDHTFNDWAKDGVHQIITGGGGGFGKLFHYLIVDADENDVTISAYKEETNTLFAQFKLSDLQNASTKDRTKNDDPGWPLNVLPCALAELALGLPLLYLAFALLTNNGINHE